MSRVRPPERPLPGLRRRDVRLLAIGNRLYRVYRPGANGSTWNTLRTVGPTTSRFDPHLEPPHDQRRAVIYAAGSVPTALAEVFGEARVIERGRGDPWLVGFSLDRDVRLLDLGGGWPAHAGASNEISSGRKDVARAWARAVYEEYDVDGLIYPSSNNAGQRRRGDPKLHGIAIALFDRARDALPEHPVVHMPLRHRGLDTALGVVAERYGYGLVA